MKRCKFLKLTGLAALASSIASAVYHNRLPGTRALYFNRLEDIDITSLVT